MICLRSVHVATTRAQNEAEEAFFNKGRFKDLPRESVGIEALCTRLSKLLLRHLVRELPSLKEEMKQKLQATQEDLSKLGEKRETTYEQRMVLMNISMEITQVLKAGLDGHYLHGFFDVSLPRPPFCTFCFLRRPPSLPLSSSL